MPDGLTHRKKFRPEWANAPDGPPTLGRKALSEELQNPLKTRFRSSEARLSSFRILERTSSFSGVVGWFFFLLPFFSFHKEEKVSQIVLCNLYFVNVSMEKREIWKIVIQTFITVLTAIGTSLGMLSCM